MKKNVASIGDIGDTRIRLLRIYKTVVDCGGFTAAEVELNISRSAISIAIADLEQYLGFKLCQRGRTGFSLTNEGASVYDFVIQMFGAVDTFRSQINNLHTQLRGELNIGITDNLVTISDMHLTNALASLKKQETEVKVNIRMMPPNEIERHVLEGRLDIGVIPELRIINGLEYTELYDEESLLYCSVKHPLFTSDELDHHLIEQQDAVLPAYEQRPDIKALYQGLRDSASATDREGIAFLLLTGQFIGFLPTHYARQWVDNNTFKSLLPDSMRYVTRYFAIKNRAGKPNLVLDRYFSLLKEIIASVD